MGEMPFHPPICHLSLKEAREEATLLRRERNEACWAAQFMFEVLRQIGESRMLPVDQRKLAARGVEIVEGDYPKLVDMWR